MKRQIQMIVMAASMLLGGCEGQSAFAQSTTAQAAKPAAPVLKKRTETVALTPTQSVAISALGEKLQKNAKDRDELLNSVSQATAAKIQANEVEREGTLAALRAVEAEIAKDRPGYHFDEATGTVVKDVPEDPAKK